MKKSILAKLCARISENWSDHRDGIMSPDGMMVFSFDEIDNGFKSGYTRDAWEKVYFENLLDSAIKKINQWGVYEITIFPGSVDISGVKSTMTASADDGEVSGISEKSRILEYYFNLHGADYGL